MSFDSFTPQTHTDCKKLSQDVMESRELLKSLMTQYGFEIYPDECWHLTIEVGMVMDYWIYFSNCLESDIKEKGRENTPFLLI